jgi:hypothetical protein
MVGQWGNGKNKEYVVCAKWKGILQWRDYEQHAIVRQL